MAGEDYPNEVCVNCGLLMARPGMRVAERRDGVAVGWACIECPVDEADG